MIDNEVEKFTATEAINAGLIDSIQRGNTIIEGFYHLTPDGYLEFRQRNFVFTDKSGGLRVGKFADNYQLMEFCEEFSKLHGIDIDEVDGVGFIANEIEEK